MEYDNINMVVSLFKCASAIFCVIVSSNWAINVHQTRVIKNSGYNDESLYAVAALFEGHHEGSEDGAISSLPDMSSRYIVESYMPLDAA